MSYFYGTTVGHRGTATRCGSKSSGITSTANGWSIGGEVEVTYSDILQTDVVTFYTTNGSNSHRSKLASFAIVDGQRQLLDTTHPELFI